MNKQKISTILFVLLPILLGVSYCASLRSAGFSNSFQYDESKARELAYLTMASYCKVSNVQSWSCGPTCQLTPQGIRDIIMFSNPSLNTSGYIGYSPASNALVLVFRGTIPWSITNWATDINTAKVNYPNCPGGCSVHKGFYNAFLGIQSQVQTGFQTLRAKYPNAKVYVTGHSLGGAISTHMVPLIYGLNNRKPIDAFYTFGSPRVGDDNYSQWFTSSNFAILNGRVTHHKDPVPHLPPNGFPFNFEHINNEIYYPSFNQGTPYTKCGNPEDNSCADGVFLPIDACDHMSYFGQDWTQALISCQ